MNAPLCCLCDNPCEPWVTGTDDPGGYGHNPEPLAPWPLRCCNTCNDTKVIRARLKRLGWGPVEFGSGET